MFKRKSQAENGDGLKPENNGNWRSADIPVRCGVNWPRHYFCLRSNRQRLEDARAGVMMERIRTDGRCESLRAGTSALQPQGSSLAANDARQFHFHRLPDNPLEEGFFLGLGRTADRLDRSAADRTKRQGLFAAFAA